MVVKGGWYNFYSGHTHTHTHTHRERERENWTDFHREEKDGIEENKNSKN